MSSRVGAGSAGRDDAGVAAIAVGCGSSSSSSSSSSSASPGAGGGNVSGEVSVMAVWSCAEQKAFQQVIDGF